MRKLIMWNVITTDGIFEGEKSWDLPWHDRIWGKELEDFSIEQLQSADALVLGRITYQGFAHYWRTAEGEVAKRMNGIRKIAFSRTLKEADWENSTIAKESPDIAIPQLKQQGDGNLFVFGSADLSSTLMKAKLFDEYRLAITPAFNGKGRRLFAEGLEPQGLDLLESRSLSTGGVILRYTPASGD